MWGKIGAWIVTNIGLPILWEVVKRYTERKKFIKSADVDETEAKAKQILKEDGFDVT